MRLVVGQAGDPGGTQSLPRLSGLLSPARDSSSPKLSRASTVDEADELRTQLESMKIQSRLQVLAAGCWLLADVRCGSDG